jgi:hypothetical protein
MNAVIAGMNFPEIVDIALPAEGVFHNLVWSGGSTRDSRVGFGDSPRLSLRSDVSGASANTAGGSPAPPSTASGAWGR